MLRFYGLYKQAVCGPCAAPRPGFWDPVGRYKWDAWSRLGEMRRESAMAEYVEEMKKVAQEVIDTMPMDEKTASFFHYFEPLYHVIDDMPRPPESLLTLREGVKGGEHTDSPAQREDEHEENGGPTEDPDLLQSTDADQEANLPEVVDVTANTIPNDSRVSEGLLLTSDSESEIFCDSVDSVEHLSNITIPVVKSNGFPNSHLSLQSSPVESQKRGRQVGAGQGGEGGEDRKGQGPSRSRRDSGRDGFHHNRTERGVPQGSFMRSVGGGGSGAGRGGGDGSEGGGEWLHEGHLQQQIILSLRRLREDMRSVMDRLDLVERLAATHARSSEWRPCLQCAAAASQQQEEKWWPFDLSGQTVLLLLLWPFVAQGLVCLLRRSRRASS
ncbi:acyl-CoA-binding domain-containing protein 4 isoform 2-T2 [Pholidichthys leucotaenia]